jgi:hypothetical protein
VTEPPDLAIVQLARGDHAFRRELAAEAAER